MPVMNDVRTALFDVSENGVQARQRVVEATTVMQLAANVGMAVCAVLALLNIVLATAFPTLGLIGALFWGLGFLACRELSVIAGNLKDCMNDAGTWRNLIGRLRAVWNEDSFAEALFQNTWVAGPLLKAPLVTLLQRSE